jgi:hypothetical protein
MPWDSTVLLFLFMPMWWGYVSELRPPTGLLFIPQVIMVMESHGGIILTGENHKWDSAISTLYYSYLSVRVLLRDFSVMNVWGSVNTWKVLIQRNQQFRNNVMISNCESFHCAIQFRFFLWTGQQIINKTQTWTNWIIYMHGNFVFCIVNRREKWDERRCFSSTCLIKQIILSEIMINHEVERNC